MYLFFSGEIGDIDGEEFRLLRNEIVSHLNKVIKFEEVDIKIMRSQKARGDLFA